MAMKSGEVDSVITGWETLRVTNLQDFESGEWLILSQWVDEPLTDLPQKNVPLIYQFARNDEERQTDGYVARRPRPHRQPGERDGQRRIGLERSAGTRRSVIQLSGPGFRQGD